MKDAGFSWGKQKVGIKCVFSERNRKNIPASCIKVKLVLACNSGILLGPVKRLLTSYPDPKGSSSNHNFQMIVAFKLEQKWNPAFLEVLEQKASSFNICRRISGQLSFSSSSLMWVCQGAPFWLDKLSSLKNIGIVSRNHHHCLSYSSALCPFSLGDPRHLLPLHTGIFSVQ